MEEQVKEDLVPPSNIVNDLRETLSQEKEARDLAALMCQMYIPRFKAHINNLTGNDVKRLIVALVEGPLAAQEYSPLTPNEKEAFLIGQTLFEARMIMLIDAIQEAEINKMEKTDTKEVTDG